MVGMIDIIKKENNIDEKSIQIHNLSTINNYKDLESSKNYL